MYYRLSNTADRAMIEREFGMSFKYPKLYEPSPVVNGLNETSIPIVTMQEKNVIDYAIWGLLPENYNDDWSVFQNTVNTLNLDRVTLGSGLWQSQCLESRRCLILATGFFCSYLRRGELYPYYVYSEDQKPFGIAGVYNKLEDGFLTCSILIADPNDFIKTIQNIAEGMPMIIPKGKHDIWLDSNTPKKEIWRLIDTPCPNSLKAHPIAKELYNKDIFFDSMLEPAKYRGIPHAVRN